MAKPLKKDELEAKDERIPFDDALRRILAAPPAHRTAKKRAPKRKKRGG